MLRNNRRRFDLKKKYAVFGIVLLAVLAAGLLATYSAPMAIADTVLQRGRGHAWWTEGLSEQQVNEIQQKIWDIKAEASAKGWTAEQTSTAIHELLAGYGITAQGSGFVDANGDGVCDNCGNGSSGNGSMNGHGRGQWRSQYMNQTACPNA
jgi:hypothetical protein